MTQSLPPNPVRYAKAPAKSKPRPHLDNSQRARPVEQHSVAKHFIQGAPTNANEVLIGGVFVSTGGNSVTLIGTPSSFSTISTSHISGLQATSNWYWIQTTATATAGSAAATFTGSATLSIYEGLAAFAYNAPRELCLLGCGL